MYLELGFVFPQPSGMGVALLIRILSLVLFWKKGRPTRPWHSKDPLDIRTNAGVMLVVFFHHCYQFSNILRVKLLEMKSTQSVYAILFLFFSFQARWQSFDAYDTEITQCLQYEHHRPTCARLWRGKEKKEIVTEIDLECERRKQKIEKKKHRNLFYKVAH